MNKITKDFLDSEIISVQYKRLSERLTHCTITVKNGFEFTGESVCVDPANYNEEIGNKIAYDNAFDKMWMPYGFLLRQKMHDEGAFPNVVGGGKMDDEVEDEPYQIKDTDRFTLELAIALAQNGDAVRNVNTGTVLTSDDCWQDAFWQLVNVKNEPNWLDCLKYEFNELAFKCKKLDEFTESDKILEVDPIQVIIMKEKLEYMQKYIGVLEQRIERAYEAKDGVAD